MKARRSPLEDVVAVYADHKDNPLETIGRLSRLEESIRGLDARGFVVLSTCNRFEVYMDSPSPGDLEGVAGLLRSQGARVRIARGRDAVIRLMRIASGLESAILGEPEIMGQVRDAWRKYREMGLTSKLLDRVFHAAVLAGRRARRETGIGRGPASYFTAALEAAEERLGGLRGARALVIGGGAAGRKLVGLLCGPGGPDRIHVASRSRERAASAAELCPGRAEPVSLDEARGTEYDVAFVAVRGYPEGALDWLPRRASLVVDMSNPHAVPPGENVVGMEELRRIVERVIEERRQWVPSVESIILEELEKLESRLYEAEYRVGEIIRALEQRAESLALEMSGGDGDYKRLRLFAKKLLHPVYVALRRAAAQGMSWEAFAEALLEVSGGGVREVPSGKAEEAQGVREH